MNIHRLLSTRDRVKVLRHVLYKTGILNVNKVATELKLSKGFVSKVFDILTKEQLLNRKKSGFFVQTNINTKSVKLFLNMEQFSPGIFKKYEFVKSAGVYGSVAKGENTEDSDIDMWIFTEKTSEKNLAGLSDDLRKKYGDVKPLYLTKKKLALLKKEDLVFYHSLVFGSITIYGESLETV